MKILTIDKSIFNVLTSTIYPPFKNGKYMEEYFYDFIEKNINKFDEIDYVYIPVFWTNLQINDDYNKNKEYYNSLLLSYYSEYSSNTKFFTIVQHDDCVLLNLPKNTLIFGACSGHISLPLIYQDTNNVLETLTSKYNIERNILCSFYGSSSHPIRNMLKYFHKEGEIEIYLKDWNINVEKNDQFDFIKLALQSKFSICPRGYGRSSFRFFESILLGSIPVYIYDDENWLPYKELIDYSKFSIVLNSKNIDLLPIILSKLSDIEITNMQTELINHKKVFGLDFMCLYIINKLSKETINYNLHIGQQQLSFI
jgi:hypothetical protein